MQLNLKEKKILQKALHSHPGSDQNALLFGSPAKGTAGKASDADIALFSENSIAFRTISKIMTELEESNLPYKVDVLDLRLTSGGFREEILKHGEQLI